VWQSEQGRDLTEPLIVTDAAAESEFIDSCLSHFHEQFITMQTRVGSTDG